MSEFNIRAYRLLLIEAGRARQRVVDLEVNQPHTCDREHLRKLQRAAHADERKTEAALARYLAPFLANMDSILKAMEEEEAAAKAEHQEAKAKHEEALNRYNECLRRLEKAREELDCMSSIAESHRADGLDR